MKANASRKFTPILSGEKLNDFHRAEMEKIGRLIKQAGIAPE